MAETIYYVDTDVVGGAGDGSSWANAYSSLNVAENARDADITGGNAVVFLCRGATNADTAAVTIGGWTLDADSYVSIVVDAEDRHAGVWSNSKYRITTSNTIALSIEEDYVRVDGLQLTVTSPAANGKSPLNVSGISATNNDIRISNCICVGHGHETYTQMGINCGDPDTNIYIWNCIAYGVAGITGNFTCNLNCASGSVYNCTFIGGTSALRTSTGTINVKNTYCGGSATEDFTRNNGTQNRYYCASEDASADDTGTGETADANCIINVAIDTDTFVSVTAGSEDFHLAAGTGSALYDTGDAPGGSAPLNYTTDIDGETVATWCIGADSRPAAASFKPYWASRQAQVIIGGGLQ